MSVATMKKRSAPDFYETQRRQWKKSLFLLLVLIIFYIFAVGLVAFVFVLSLGLFFKSLLFPSGSHLLKIGLLIASIATLIALYHFYDAKRFGAKFIRRRLQAAPPDMEDRYHKQFANSVEEIRLATGLPQLTPYILPSFAINSMALIEADNTPSILVTEGLLAEFTRDELGAVIAHEAAHVLRGDTFYITLVCSLANFFERMRQAAEPDTKPAGYASKGEETSSGAPLVFIALTLSYVIMHLLSALISREREILADAAAVEFSRNPRALARGIYKAHLKNSFVGDFSLTYSPLFIVPPRSTGIQEGLFSRIFNSHPPLMSRIKLLAQMVPTSPAKIIDEVWEIQRNREKAREVLVSNETTHDQGISIDEEKNGSALQERKIWSVSDPKGKWLGPLALEDLLFLPFFTPLIRTKNLQEGVIAQAAEFPQIRKARQSLLQKKPIDPAKHNLCPRCHIPLREHYYEGVTLKICGECRGKLVGASMVDRIITRKEVAFSEKLIQKAQEFKRNFMDNPTLLRKLGQEKSTKISCPECGNRMLLRPYSYHYIIPVDKCLSCYKVWFDSDELEILQVLIEHREPSA